jgi:hypothetical protein
MEDEDEGTPSRGFSLYYFLNEDKTCSPCDYVNFIEWFNTQRYEDRMVNRTYLPNDVAISTIFIGINHNFSPLAAGDPILFETMVFGGEHDTYTRRYHTWQEAVEGHNETVAMVTSSV